MKSWIISSFGPPNFRGYITYIEADTRKEAIEQFQKNYPGHTFASIELESKLEDTSKQGDDLPDVRGLIRVGLEDLDSTLQELLRNNFLSYREKNLISRAKREIEKIIRGWNCQKEEECK